MKKVLALLLVGAMVLSFAACGKDKDKDKADQKSDTAVTTEAPKKEETTKKDLPIVGTDPVTIENVCEFNVDYTAISKDVMPPQPADYYSHYEAEAGKTYVDLCIAYKNIATTDVRADKVISAKLSYGDKYEFTGFSIVEEDSRGDFTYSNITSISPLSTEYIHYLFAVPEDVETSSGSLTIDLAINEQEYRVIVRDGEALEDNAKSTTTKNSSTKTVTAVSAQEKVTTQNAEFFVDSSQVTKDVMPPQPANYYTHYEAEAGKAYVDFCIGYKNTSNSNVSADKVLSAKLKYADKYDYSGFSIIEEDSRGDFTYSNITSIAPLSTEYVHYLFEVPEDVMNSSESIVVTFSIDGNSYTYAVR